MYFSLYNAVSKYADVVKTQVLYMKTKSRSDMRVIQERIVPAYCLIYWEVQGENDDNDLIMRHSCNEPKSIAGLKHS